MHVNTHEAKTRLSELLRETERGSSFVILRRGKLALAFGLPDERSARADKFRGRVSDDNDVWVPTLWWYEISDALRMARRRVPALHRPGRASRAVLLRLGLPRARRPPRPGPGHPRHQSRQGRAQDRRRGLALTRWPAFVGMALLRLRGRAPGN